MADFTAELRGQGHGPATVVKYHREAAAFAAWLGEEEPDGGAGRGIPGPPDGLPHHDWGQWGGIRPE